MQPFNLDDLVHHLRRTPGTLRAMLVTLPDGWIDANYGEGSFSPRDVVGHLVLGEKIDWIPRARIILEHGESRPFDPFPHTGVDDETKDLPIGDLLDIFEQWRTRNIETLTSMNLSEEQLEARGTHPDPNFRTVTLRQLLAAWMVHDQHHLAQICKAIGRQYGTGVGPWREYIGLLNK